MMGSERSLRDRVLILAECMAYGAVASVGVEEMNV